MVAKTGIKIAAMDHIVLHVKDMEKFALRLEVGTYDEVKATLEAAGVKVHNRPGDERCIYVADPDGHRLQLLAVGEPR
jgi:hypothetical protein